MSKIVVVGSINTDMVVHTPRIPRPGETILGYSFVTTGGGKGANQAVAAVRLGGSVLLIGRVGNDGFGRQSIQQFEREGIDTSYISIDPEAPSGVALITIDEQAENSIVVAPGANGRLSPKDVLAGEPAIQQADLALFQLEIPMTTVAAGIQLARQHSCQVMLNPAPAAELSNEILRMVDILTPNQTEAQLLTGIEVDGPESAARAAEMLHERGVENLVITLGAAGAFVSLPGEAFTVAGFEAGPVVDTVAAGDTFCGALAIAIAEGKNWKDAVQFANAAAALSVTRHGAQASIPSRKDVEILLNPIA